MAAGSKGKRADKRPARLHYWSSGKLSERKIKNLMRHNGLTRAKAEQYWLAVRGNRRTPMKQQGVALTPEEQKALYKKIA